MSLILEYSIADLPPLQTGPRCGGGLMRRGRTDCKPRASNGLLQGDKGVLREWLSAAYPRNAGAIFRRVSGAFCGPVWPVL